MRSIALILSLSLILSACGTSPAPSGGSDDAPPVVAPTPTPEPTPTPPATPEPPTDEPVAPPEEEPTPPQPSPPDGEPTPPAPPTDPAPPSEEPPTTPPAQPAPPPSQPVPPAEEPAAPTISATRTPGGPAPWTVAYTWEEVREGYYIHLTCEGIPMGDGMCHHTHEGQTATLELREADTYKVVETLTLDPGIKPMEGGVPYYGTWDYSVDGVVGSFSLVEFDTDFDGRPGGVALDYSAAMFVDGEVRFTVGEELVRLNTLIEAMPDGTQRITLGRGYVVRR